MTKLRPEELAQGQLDAYNQRDLETFIKFYSDDVEVMDFPSGIVRLQGIQGLKEVYRELFDQSPNLSCKLIKRVCHDQVVIDQEVVTGIRGGPERAAVAIYQVVDGLIAKVWFVKSL